MMRISWEVGDGKKKDNCMEETTAINDTLIKKKDTLKRLISHFQELGKQ